MKNSRYQIRNDIAEVYDQLRSAKNLEDGGEFENAQYAFAEAFELACDIFNDISHRNARANCDDIYILVAEAMYGFRRVSEYIDEEERMQAHEEYFQWQQKQNQNAPIISFGKIVQLRPQIDDEIMHVYNFHMQEGYYYLKDAQPATPTEERQCALLARVEFQYAHATVSQLAPNLAYKALLGWHCASSKISRLDQREAERVAKGGVFALPDDLHL